MIICIIGGIGSGKTLSVVKEIVSSNNLAITNFRLKGVSYQRLRVTDILAEETDKKGNRRYTGVNWKYWEKFRDKNFSIFLDEAHNIIHSRTSMTKSNILMSKWVSQIRKITGDSDTNHLYIITQVPRRIDVAFRDLTQIVIRCEMLTLKDKNYVIQKFYNGFDMLDYNICSLKTYFFANPYFKYYDRKEMVRFEDAEEFV